MTLTSPTIPDPLETVENKVRNNSLGAVLSVKLQKYTVLLAIGLILSLLLLTLTWVGLLAKKPDYKLGNTIVEVVAPAPHSVISGLTNINLNIVTTEDPKVLRAFVKSGDSNPAELKVAEVGQNIIGLTGSWNPEDAKEASFIEVTVYNVSSENHPVIVSYSRIPVTINK